MINGKNPVKSSNLKEGLKKTVAESQFFQIGNLEKELKQKWITI